MAVAYQTYTSASHNNALSVSPAKPTGLAVGDVMVGYFVIAGIGETLTPPSGFTQIETASTVRQSAVYWKIADAADVAASSFTFTNGGTANMDAFLFRVSGGRNVSSVPDSSGQSNSNSTTCTIPAVTPIIANSLILMITNSSGTNSGFSGYQIATSNPTWTEIYDTSLTSGFHNGAAWAVRPETTSTGSGTATLQASSENHGFMVVISPDQNFSLSDTTTATDSVTGIRTLLLSVSDTLGVTDTVISTINRIFNLAKNISTWVNGDKN